MKISLNPAEHHLLIYLLGTKKDEYIDEHEIRRNVSYLVCMGKKYHNSYTILMDRGLLLRREAGMILEFKSYEYALSDKGRKVARLLKRLYMELS